jgi:hypothetical protein
MRSYLLTVGEYADETPLGIVRANDIAVARRMAGELTLQRIRDDEPDDMTYVAVTEIADLTEATETLDDLAARGVTVTIDRPGYDRIVGTLKSADEVLDRIFGRIDRAEQPDDVIADAETRVDLTSLGNWTRAVLRRLEALTR